MVKWWPPTLGRVQWIKASQVTELCKHFSKAHDFVFILISKLEHVMIVIEYWCVRIFVSIDTMCIMYRSRFLYMQICRFKYHDSHFFPICYDSSDPVWSCLETSYHLRSFLRCQALTLIQPPRLSKDVWGFLLPLSLLLLCYFALCLLKLGKCAKWWCFCGSGRFFHYVHLSVSKWPIEFLF